MGVDSKSERKRIYYAKLLNCMETYSKIFVVNVDHVGSRQMSSIRKALRGQGVILMGKNTMIRKALIEYAARCHDVEKLINCVKMNVGFVFCDDDLQKVKEIIVKNKVPAPARQGIVAPVDVFVPAGGTGMDPGQTSFFQALGIPTKINKAQIEIESEVHLIEKGRKVTASQVVLLQKLDIKPFSYGFDVKYVYDNGSLYDAKVLDITDEDIFERFSKGISNLSAFCREAMFPTECSVHHSILEGFKNCIAFALESDYNFKEVEDFKMMMSNQVVVSEVVPAKEVAKPKELQKKEESESDDDMGFSLFD